MKAKLVISYDGSSFSGFARQKDNKNIATVTEVFEESLRNSGIFTPLIGAGRTDAGVHATRQCVAFKLPAFWDDSEKLKKELDRKLHPSIKIKSCEIVGDDFHPRFDVKKRAYRYVVSLSMPNPFANRFVMFAKDIDFEQLDLSIAKLNGTHDFSFFKKSGGNDKQTTRELGAKYYTKGDLLVFVFESNGFLRSQIRMLVSFLLEIATGKLSVSQLEEQLGCIRKHSTKIAPPNGLYLTRVVY